MRPADPALSIPEGALLPCVVQHADTGRVLMLAYMDAEALAATLETGLGHFHSRSRERLWKKGETSGNVLAVTSLAADCDGDAILMLALPAGPTCHIGTESCFDSAAPALPDLARTIAERAERAIWRLVRRGPSGRGPRGPSAEGGRGGGRDRARRARERPSRVGGGRPVVPLDGAPRRRRPRSARPALRARTQTPRSRCVSGIGNGRPKPCSRLTRSGCSRYPWQAGTIPPAAQPFSGRKVA